MRPLFRLGGTSKRHPLVTQWLEDHQDALGNIARHWFEAIRASGSDVEETLHDGQPTACVDGAAFAYVDAFTTHVNVGFFQGAELTDPEGLLEGSGKFMRHVKLRPGQKIDEPALIKLISSAYNDVKTRLVKEK